MCLTLLAVMVLYSPFMITLVVQLPLFNFLIHSNLCDHLSNTLEKALKELVDFEAAYGALLTAERATTSRSRLTADPPSTPPKGSAWRPGTDAAFSTASPQRQRPQTASRSPPRSVIRRSRSAANLANIPSRLLDLTSTRHAYITELSAQRGVTPSSLLDAVSSRWRREPAAAGSRGGSEIGIPTTSSRPSSPARLRPKSSNGTAESSGALGTATRNSSASQDRQEYTPPVLRKGSTERPSSAPAYRPRPHPRRESLIMNSAILELPDDAQTDRSSGSASVAGMGAGALSTGGMMVGTHQVAKLRGPAGFSSIISTTLRQAPETQPTFHF
jgi:hypothetical protein